MAVAVSLAAIAPASAADNLKPPPALASGLSIDASIDGLYGKRNHSDAIIVQDTVTTATVLSGDNFSFDNKGGVDARLRVGYGAWSLEGRYFGGFNWSASRNDLTPAIWNLPTAPPLFGTGFANLDSDSGGRLHSFEANLRWRANSQIVVFVGGRWISQPDNLTLTANFGGNAATIAWDSTFKARGPQVGIEARLFGPGTWFNPFERVFLDIDGRIAYLWASGNQTFSVVQTIGPAFGASGSFDRTTFAYELGAALGVVISPNVELRAGYRYFVLDEGVFAGDLIGTTDVLTPTVGPVSSRVSVSSFTLGVRAMFP